MNLSVARWLEDRIGRPRAGQTTLVLCRSRATTALVRRWIATRKGWIGIEVTTPHGLAASAWRPPLVARLRDPDTPIPEDNPIAAKIGERPGLVAACRHWVRRAREARLVGRDLAGLPDWLLALEESGWADDGEDDALANLLARAAVSPRALSESHRWDRVVLLGFDVGVDGLDLGSRAVAAAMGGRALREAPEPDEAPIPMRPVPDAVAEVREAARLCAERPDDTVVLVAEASTARRLRSALLRNGVPCGFTEPQPIAGSPLGALVARVAPWFAEPDPALRVTDVAAVFGSTALGATVVPAVQRRIEADRDALGLEGGTLGLGRRRLVRLLQAARVLDAPLSAWRVRLRVLIDDPHEDADVRGAALALDARLELLDACIAGNGPQAWSGDDALDDYDQIVAELLGDHDLDPAASTVGTLGGVRLLLQGLRARVHDDPAARAVLAALRDRADRPANAATAREALNGPVDPGALGTGVDVVAYDDWDGRPAGQLILLDVHHQGLSRRPAPDPLLGTAEQAVLGQLAGQALVDHRVRQVRRAVAAAERAVAIVAQRDAGGRDLVPPIQLELVSEVAAGRSYGLGSDVPDIRRLRALVVDDGAEPTAPDGDLELAQLAIQATAEWYRAGRAPAGPGRTADRYDPLDARLAAVRPIAPGWVLPWLGHAEGVVEAALPDRPWSVSRLFDPLSSCLYRAFAGAVLRVEEPERIAEDLDPREIGTAIHDALEEVGAGLSLRVPEEELEQARAAVVEALRENSDRQLQIAALRLRGLSPSRQAAVAGRMARWKAHWPSWAASRVQPLRSAHESVQRDFVQAHPVTVAAAAALVEAVPATARVPERTRVDWLVHTARAIDRGDDPHGWPPALLAREQERYGALSASYAEGLRAFVDGQAFRDVCSAWKSARIRAGAVGQPIELTGVELPFGPSDRPGRIAAGGTVTEHGLGEIRVRLGSGDVALSGRIDRVSASRYGGRPLLEVVDYKTGRSRPASVYAATAELRNGGSPQLPLYALALREAVRLGRLGPELEGATIASVGWDHVRFTERITGGRREVEPTEYTRILVDNQVLDGAASRIGALVDEARAGRWTLHPRPDTCGALNVMARCPYAGVCRLRGLPAGGADDPE